MSQININVAVANANKRKLTDNEVIELFEGNHVSWCEAEGQRMILALQGRGIIASDCMTDSQLQLDLTNFEPTHPRFITAHITKTYRLARRIWQMPIFYKALYSGAMPWIFNIPNQSLGNNVAVMPTAIGDLVAIGSVGVGS